MHTQSYEGPELGPGAVAGSPKIEGQETEQGATELVGAREKPWVSDMQGWEEQGPDRWLTGDDGRCMSGEEIDEGWTRLDALIMKLTREKEAAARSRAEPDASR